MRNLPNMFSLPGFPRFAALHFMGIIDRPEANGAGSYTRSPRQFLLLNEATEPMFGVCSVCMLWCLPIGTNALIEEYAA